MIELSLVWSAVFGSITGASKALKYLLAEYLGDESSPIGQYLVFMSFINSIFFASIIFGLAQTNTKLKTQAKDIFKCILCFSSSETEDEIKSQRLFLVFRCILGAFTGIFQFFSLRYIYVGDLASLSNACTILVSFCVSMYMFKKYPSAFVVLVSVPLCIIGIIFIEQPSFIFSGYGGQSQLSYIGFLLACLGGVGRGLSDFTSKKLKKVHWSIVSFVAAFGGIFVSMILLLFEIYYMGEEWQLWSSVIPNLNCYVFFPFSLIIYFMFNTLAFQKGILYQVSIIITIVDVLVSYIFQYTLLESTHSILTYVGVVLIIISVVPIKYEIFKMRSQPVTDGADHPYQIIEDKA